MKIFRFLKRYWYFALLAPIMMIGEVYCELSLPTLMANIVNNGVLLGDIDLIISIGKTMLIFLCFQMTFGIMCSVFTVNASHNFANDLRREVFTKIMDYSFEQIDDFSTGSLVTRVTNDVVQVQSMLQMAMRFLIRVVMLFSMGLYMMLSLNLEFGFVVAITIPLLIVTVYVILKKVIPYFSKSQKCIDEVNTVVEENVNGMRVIKAYVREDYEFDRFQQANLNLATVNLKIGHTFSFMLPIVTILMQITIVFIIYIGGIQIDTGSMAVGDVMAAITYVSAIMNAVIMFGQIFQTLSRSRVSAARLNAVLDLDPTIKSSEVVSSDLKGCVEFKNVSFTYPGSDEVVLDNVSFSLQKGETLGILGATGSGKSSLVNLIPRFYEVTDGEVLIDGINVKEYNLETLRSKVSLVLQKAELYSKTIRENIAFGKVVSDEELIKACKVAQSYNFIQSSGNGFETIVAEKGASLSGGQKQRVAISRALVHAEELLVFDDSTSALDLKTEALLLQKMKEEYKDITKIIVAQRISSVKDSDNIMVLDNGKIVSYGPHDKLIETSEVYQDIYYSQISKGGEFNG